MTDTSPTRIGIIGAGWRAQYFLRVARELPVQFEVVGVLTRSEGSAVAVTNEWSVPATTSIADFLSRGPYEYVVVAAPRDIAPELVLQLVRANIPVLAETPPAGDIEDLFALYSVVGDAPVQVAEQYQFQPQHAARLAVARSGLIGDITAARISVAHGYHGVSLIRLALGAGFAPTEIRAHTAPDVVMSARGRDSWNAESVETNSERTTASFSFESATGYFDFSLEQYFSPIRARHFDLYGSMGELEDDRVSRLAGSATAVHESLYRESTGLDGDLEGSFLRRIQLGERVLYENRFAPARLNDDELAVAETMQRMSEYVRGGDGFYGLADASHDHYLALLMDDAASRDVPVRSAVVPWSDARSVAVRR